MKQWRTWRSDLERYVDAVDEKLKEEMNLVKDQKEEITERKFAELGGTRFSKAKDLMTLLLKKTSGSAQNLIKSCPPDNGFEAWRRMNAFYEPTLAVRESEVMADFAFLCRRQAKDIHDLRRLLLEMDEKSRRYEEVVGKPPDDMHAKSILTAILDADTRKHTIAQQALSFPFEDSLKRVQELINAVGAGVSPQKGDLTAVNEDQYWAPCISSIGMLE